MGVVIFFLLLGLIMGLWSYECYQIGRVDGIDEGLEQALNTIQTIIDEEAADVNN